MKLFTLLLLLLASVSYGQITANIPTSGLHAFYAFSGNSNDVTGNGNDGTANAPMLTQDRHGAADSAYEFNGTTDVISISNSNSFDLEKFTLSGWVRTTSNSGFYKTVFSHWQNPQGNDYYGYWLGLFEGQATFFLGLGTSLQGGFPIIDSNNVINDGNWHHIAATYGEQDSIARLYVDGALRVIDTVQMGVLPGAVTDIGNDFYGEAFVGDLDEIGVWTRLLSACEIDGLYSGTSSLDLSIEISGDVITSNEPGMTYQWVRCDQNYDTIVGATAMDYTVTENGRYAVFISDGTCTSLSECVEFTNVGLMEQSLMPSATLIKTVDVTGREVDPKTHKGVVLYLYSNGVVLKKVNAKL